MPKSSIRQREKGDLWIWATGSMVTIALLMILVLLGVILVNGLGYFWPKPLAEMRLTDGSVLAGEITSRETSERGGEQIASVKLKMGNRDLYGLDFRWVEARNIESEIYPEDLLKLERLEHGDFFGRIVSVQAREKIEWKAEGPAARLRQLKKALADEVDAVEDLKRTMSTKSRKLGALRLDLLKLNYRNRERNAERIKQVETEQAALDKAVLAAQKAYETALLELEQNRVVMVEAGGMEQEVRVIDIVRMVEPNALLFGQKMGVYFSKVWELLSDSPRESNTEGGLFPAIFGTVMMVFIMSIFCMPLGVVAAIYLVEYAKEGPIVRVVRIAVNNLAGVPSIVYGVFGLGFFVYGVGGSIDELFFPERLPEATFGTGGILWASLTLALLTVPVVIVATVESLNSIPRGMREGSLALGATKFQTVARVLLPMASPGILTGFILSMARAAGEVAPLMLTGVIKSVQSLPLDATAPFLHLDRKFMHLGFHIYDVGFQSPNVEAAKPMVFVTTLLLLLIVIALNIVAIRIRNRMRQKYTMGAF